MRQMENEEEALRSVALQNAQTILLARQRSEEELLRAKESLELKTAELAHSLAIMRATLESTTDGILVTDGDGRVTNFNKKFVAMWQLPDEILKSSEPRQLLEFMSRYLDDRNHFLAAVDNIYSFSLPETYDLLELIDGRVIERFSRIQFVSDRNVGRVWSFRDITKRRRDEEKLRRSESQLRMVMDHAPVFIARCDTEGRFRFVNRGYAQRFGLRPDEIIGKSIAEVVGAHAFDSIRHYVDLVLSGEAVEFEIELPYERIGRRHMLCAYEPERDSTGQVRGWVAVVQDITSRKRAEQTSRFLADASAALAELTDYESTLQRIASLAVPFFADWCAVDMQEADGSIRRLAVIHANPGKVQLIHELERKFPSLPTDPRGIRAVLRSGEPEWSPAVADELLTELVQGNEHLNLIRELGLKSYIRVPLKSRGKVLGVLTFVTAESDRAYGVDDLRAAEDLAHRAVIAIENATLLAALKETDQRKDEFLAMLAHELRNPLAPIRNSVQILRAKAPPIPELQWAREVIDRQAEQLTRLVDDLLDVSRITRGNIQLRKQRVELNAVVNSAVESSRPLIEKWGHELTVTIPAEPIYLDADLTRLAQVILNLLNNAAKYTDQGGHISLTAEQQDGYVFIRVKDTGIGIPRQMLSHIFDMFTQVDRTLERSQGGLGIGLTLVKRVVEMHGGTVDVRSEGAGTGSEFVVRLPIAQDQTDGGATEALDDAEMRVAPKRRILVVDDNRDAADSLGMLLRLLGNEVCTAHDGLEAVDVAADFHPDVVLLDIGLPKLNGYDAARRIRKQQDGANIVLFALTGWGQEEDRRRSKEAGFDYHLTKPVDFRSLQEFLARKIAKNN